MTMEDIAEIKGVVKRTVEEGMEIYNEKWVTAEELCKECQMFTKDWLTKYGEVLGAQRARVYVDGRWFETKGAAYPLHRIKKMIHTGEIRKMTVKNTSRMSDILDYGKILVGA